MGSYLSTVKQNEKAMTSDEIYQEYLKILSDRLGVEGDLEINHIKHLDNDPQSKCVTNTQPVKKINKMHLDYFNEYEHYVTQFNHELVIVLYQVGSFYEMYQDDTRGPDILMITKITGLMNVSHQSYPGIKLLGFPIRCLPKYRDIFLSNNYNVIVMNQLEIPFGIQDRFVASIETPKSLNRKIDTINIRTSNLGVNTSKTTTIMPTKSANMGYRTYGGGQRHLRNVFIKTHEGKSIVYNDIFLNDTIESLKEKIGKTMRMSTDNFYLVYHGSIMLREDAKLEDYNYIMDHTIEVRLHNSTNMSKQTRS